VGKVEASSSEEEGLEAEHLEGTDLVMVRLDRLEWALKAVRDGKLSPLEAADLIKRSPKEAQREVPREVPAPR